MVPRRWSGGAKLQRADIDGVKVWQEVQDRSTGRTAGQNGAAETKRRAEAAPAHSLRVAIGTGRRSIHSRARRSAARVTGIGGAAIAAWRW